MIVKVAGGRRDGKSSFEDLGAYLTEGILQSGEPPLKTSWDALTQYITADSVLNSLGDEVEKTIAVEIGNVNSLKTAPLEMRAVAKNNSRQKDPVYHYILSWPEKEMPDTQDIFKAARHTLKALGLLEHQYIIAIHANTDNLHAHIEVNRIHPKTFKAATLNWTHATLHKAAREAEIEFGWSHDNGIYEVVEVNGQKQIVKAEEKGEIERINASSGARNFEVWNGEESLVSWCRGEPAGALKAVLADARTSTWQNVHDTLARFGLELRESGGSGMKIFDVGGNASDRDGKPLAVSASNAFRFMKRADLEQRFGPFHPRTNGTLSATPERTYKRDPVKRLERKLERRGLRDALYARFKQDVEIIKQQRIKAKEVIAEVFDDDKKAFEELSVRYRQKREEVKAAKELTPTQKKALHMVNRLSMQQERLALKELLAESRAERRSLIPSLPVWREWVEQQAQLGDEAAISALRGLIYQDGRNAKKAGKAQEGTLSPRDTENSIRPALNTDTDPYARSIQNMVWKVLKNGRVSYSFKSGEAAFVDDGDKLAFDRKHVSDEALMASLRYAADKWGGELHLSGGDAAFKERVVNMAVKRGIRIANPELQALQHRLSSSFPQSSKRESLTDDIENLIRTRDKTAHILYPGIGSKSYAGPIVGENSRYIAQYAGGNQYVVHDKSVCLGQVPRHGKSISISYKNGNGKINAKKSKGGMER